MKNKKGFTIIELGVSICLVTVVAFLLFQMITTVKKLYTSSDIKTTLLTKQAIMTKKIYDELDQKIINVISLCDNFQNSCLKFNFSDGSSSELSVDPLNHKVSYNNYVVDYEQIDENIEFGELTYNSYTNFFSVIIPITTSNSNDNNNYGINITKQIEKGDNTIDSIYTNTTITIPLTNKEGLTDTTTITYDGTDYWMRIYDSSKPNLNAIMSSRLKYLKLDTCSNTEVFTGNVYELKTGNNTSRWCQPNNLYTQEQRYGTYQYISGILNEFLHKDNYVESLTTSSKLASTTLDLKVNNFINKYTFKSRKV